jgi:hypothetical protein
MRSTQLDPGDKGQVAQKAMQYMSNIGMNAEDAWVTALTNWMTGMPWPDGKRELAHAMIRFIEVNEGKVPLSAMVILSARQNAERILSSPS